MFRPVLPEVLLEVLPEVLPELRAVHVDVSSECEHPSLRPACTAAPLRLGGLASAAAAHRRDMSDAENLPPGTPARTLETDTFRQCIQWGYSSSYG